MNNDPTRRYQIWALAKPGQADLEKLEPGPARRDHPERKKRQEGFGNPARSLSEIDDPASSLYHYGLPIEIELRGLCTLPNGRSTACKTKKISSESADFIYDLANGGYRFKLPDEMPAGSPMHLDLDRLGEFHGALTSQNSAGFKIAVDGDCKDMLSNRLALLAAAIRGTSLDDASVAAKPSVTRLEPDSKSCRFTDHTGTLRKGWVINVSQIDALIKAPIVPPVGAHIVFSGPRRYAAEVTRAFEIGFAVKFCDPIPAEEFSAAIKFLDE
ncbi:MAG: hypothetical protein WCF20_08980 [Methylovirgula sp.]